MTATIYCNQVDMDSMLEYFSILYKMDYELVNTLVHDKFKYDNMFYSIDPLHNMDNDIYTKFTQLLSEHDNDNDLRFNTASTDTPSNTI